MDGPQAMLEGQDGGAGKEKAHPGAASSFWVFHHLTVSVSLAVSEAGKFE